VPSDPRCGARGRYVSPELAEVLVNGMQGATGSEPRTPPCRSGNFRFSASWPKGRVSPRSVPRCSSASKTVSTYRTRILEKMGMKSNADMTYYAIKNDLVQ